ncbi:YqxA family protein [Metabacillus indicus]|uniref:YqxA family protein n=1 Tax=Metabacillus indicus TaxID=246786 RepID=UPI00317EC2FD
MIKFMLKCFVLCSVLLFGVLFGMQQANHGLVKMKGYEDPKLSSAFEVKNDASGELEASVLGNTHNLEEKQQKLEDMEAFNFFSQLGKTFASFASAVITGLISFLASMVESLFQ